MLGRWPHGGAMDGMIGACQNSDSVHQTQNQKDGKNEGYTAGTMKAFMASGKDPKRPASSGGELKREKAASEHGFMKFETKERGKRDLRLWRSTMKLLHLVVPLGVSKNDF